MEVNVKGCNESLIGIFGEAIVEDIKADNYSKMIQDMKPQIQETQIQ